MSGRVRGSLGGLWRRLRGVGTPVDATSAQVAAPHGPPAWLELTEDTLGRLPLEGEEIRLLVRNPGVVRALTRAPGPEFSRVVIALTSWRAPTPGWRGALGPMPGLVSAKLTWPPDEKGRVTVALDFAAPVPLGSVARAVLPLLIPTHSMSAFGSPEVVVDAASDERALAVLGRAWAQQLVPEPDPVVLRGADVLVVAESPALTEVQVVRRVVDLTRAPLIDLHVHRPVGRRRPDPSSAPTRASLVTRDGSLVVRDERGTTLVTLALERPLRESQVRKLRTVDAISLANVGAPLPVGVADRIAEIAAVGPVLHDGSSLASSLVELDPTLVALFGRRLPVDTLDLTLRSVQQVRRVVRAHSGLAVQDTLARENGWSQALPAVSVVLASRRTDAALSTLRMLGAQTYPRLEVVLAMHGASAPDLSELDAATRALVSTVLEVRSDEVFGHVLAQATAATSGVLLTKVDDDDSYGPEHIWDLVQAYLWSGAQVVGKQPEYVYLEGRDQTVHRTFRTEAYVRQVAGGTIMISAPDLMAVGGWRPVPRSVDRALLLRVLQAGGLLYATRGPGFVYTRHDRGHTWLADDEEFLTRVIERWDGLPSRLVAG